jgi:hypothetical protein
MSAPEPLFNPAETMPPKCTARDCQAGTRKNLCGYDADRDQGQLVGKRPRGCLNAHDPSKGVIPY